MAPPTNRDEVDRLVVEHLPVALRVALRLTGDPHTAEDVVQESLCRVLRKWQTYRGEAPFRSWMLRIVVNVDRDRRRSQGPDESPMPVAELASRGASPLEHAAADELRLQVRAAINRLPPRQREVALLCLGEGLAPGEVAATLDITEANVHTCLHFARKRIARAIGVDLSKPSSI